MQHTHAFSLPASLSTNGFVKTNQIISQGFLSSRRTSLQKHQFLFQRRKRKEPEHISRGNAFSIKYEGLTKSNNFLKKKNKNRKQNGAVNTKKAPKGMPERGPKLAFQTLGLTRSSVCSSLHNGRGASTQSLTILQEKKKKGWYALLSITVTHLFEKTEKVMLGRKHGQEMPFKIFFKTIHAGRNLSIYSSLGNKQQSQRNKTHTQTPKFSAHQRAEELAAWVNRKVH